MRESRLAASLFRRKLKTDIYSKSLLRLGFFDGAALNTAAQ